MKLNGLALVLLVLSVAAAAWMGRDYHDMALGAGEQAQGCDGVPLGATRIDDNGFAQICGRRR